MAAPPDQVLELLREVVAPLVRADGGELHLVELSGNVLSLHLSGRFSGCPGNTLARRRVLEPLLASRFPELKVEISSGPRVPEGATSVLPQGGVASP
jgi:Fe-S cluster biogenesis protein NfuA